MYTEKHKMLRGAINLSVIGIIPWREFVPATDPPAPVVSTLIEKIHGSVVATVVTILVLVTIIASVFASTQPVAGKI